MKLLKMLSMAALLSSVALSSSAVVAQSLNNGGQPAAQPGTVGVDAAATVNPSHGKAHTTKAPKEEKAKQPKVEKDTKVKETKGGNRGSEMTTQPYSSTGNMPYGTGVRSTTVQEVPAARTTYPAMSQ